MGSYGELIREIRLSKGLTQKEVYTGIISRSYAIGFEKGKHEITLSLFEEILKRIMVPLDEFFLFTETFLRQRMIVFGLISSSYQVKMML